MVLIRIAPSPQKYQRQAGRQTRVVLVESSTLAHLSNRNLWHILVLEGTAATCAESLLVVQFTLQQAAAINAPRQRPRQCRFSLMEGLEVGAGWWFSHCKLPASCYMSLTWKTMSSPALISF